MFAYGNMIIYDPTLMDLTSYFFVPFTNVKVYLYIVQLFIMSQA